MTKEERHFRLMDTLYLILALLPLAAGLLLNTLTTPASGGMDITGALIYFTIPMPFQDLPITEAQVNSWLVLISIFWICRYLTHGLSSRPYLRRQHILEIALSKVDSFVKSNMGEYFKGFAPFVTSIMVLSACSSLMSLLGLFPPTSDLNIVAGWAILVFILITYYKCKCGIGYYLKGFMEPIVFFAPMNVISELATPISMAFRHYGNVLSGSVISVLVATALQGVSSLVLGWLPGFLGDLPLFQIGLPAVLSIYFDVFSGCLQAFIFAMLTMLYIANGFPAEDYAKRKAKKAAKAAGSL